MKNIKIVILGSGTCVPSLDRSSCSALADTGSEVVLFDLGPGTMRRLLEAGYSVFDITHIGLSHFHPDHSGELVPFLFANKYPDGSLRRKTLTIIGGKGFSSFFQKLQEVYGEWIDGAGKLELVEMDSAEGEGKRFGSFALKAAQVRHRPESIAFRLDFNRGESIVYSGDTDFSEELVQLARGADALICECSLPDELKVEGHLCPSLAGKTASLADAGRLVLTHFYPECEQADIEGQCRTKYSGPLVLARDLYTFSLGKGT